MRTPKELYTERRMIYHPELTACPQCDGPLELCNYLAWDKTVQTLAEVTSIASRPGRCACATCPGHALRLPSAQAQQIAPLGSTYGYDVVVRLGWFRQDHQATYAEIQAELGAHVTLSVSQVRHLYQHIYLPLLACQERAARDRLAEAAAQHGGLIIALDGLAPLGGEPQLWFIREVLTGLTLRSGWLSQQDQPSFEAFLEPLRHLDWPILAVLSDKQRGLVPAVASVLGHSRHQFCQAHYLRNLAAPLAEVDEAFKVRLRKAVRQVMGEAIRAETASDTPGSGIMSVTGLLPDGGPAAEPPPPPTDPLPPTSADQAQADAVIVALLRRIRYLLTLTGRPPFRLAGLETYQGLQAVARLSAELLAHRLDQRLAPVLVGLHHALAEVSADYAEVQQGARWLGCIADLLTPSEDGSTAKQVAHALRTYLNDLAQLPHLSERLAAFRAHLDTLSTSYWSGLFHTYDLAELPRTNNGLESHFRDTQRRLLRTSGQRGQTRRALERLGAWELLPRPPTEPACLASMRQVPPTELSRERQRVRQHQDRFRLHTRSVRQATAQLDHLRQQWLALPATSTA